MQRAFVGMGSNINPALNIRRAVRLLSKRVNVVKVSTVYCTKPAGRPEQPDFFNCVVEIMTDLEPTELKNSVLRRIEDALGRKRKNDKFAPRTIDLDLILYGALSFSSDELTLPAPDILEKPFLAIPLNEIAPNMNLPGLCVSTTEIASKMTPDSMKPLTSYTELLKKEIL